MAGEWPHPRNGSDGSTPQLMSGFRDPSYLYGVHIRKNGGALAFRWHEPTDVYEVIELREVAGNALELPLIDPGDAHYALTVGCDADEVLHVMGNHHDEDEGERRPHYVVCHDVQDFTNPASWAAGDNSHAAALDLEGDGGTSTYHLLERLTDGTLLWLQSQSELRTSAKGRDWLAFKRVGRSWVPLVGDGHFATTEDGADTEADRVYVSGVHVERRPRSDRVHVYGAWRTDDTSADSQQQPWYLRSDDLTTWRTVTGQAQPMPLTWAQRAAATIGSAPAISATTCLGVVVDPESGHPSVIVRDGRLADRARYVRLAWDGATWGSNPLPVLGGVPREHVIKGERWIRFNDGGRVNLASAVGGRRLAIGGQVEGTFSANPDPIWLRERGVYAVNIGDGNTPRIFTFGNGARMRVAARRP